MSAIIDKLFDPSARERVATAVRDAERGTSGEIVPCIVEMSDEYEESLWLAALIGAGVALLVIALVYVASGSWAVLCLSVFALFVAGCAAIGALFAALSMKVRVALAGRSTVYGRTHHAARVA